MKPTFLPLIFGTFLAVPLFAAPVRQSPEIPDLPRLVLYYQTTHDPFGRPISILPLVTEKHIALTHLIVCSFHINYGGIVHLNDHPPQSPLFYTLWNETRVMQAAGVKVMGMVGGATPGAFTRSTLDSADVQTFDGYYSQLRNVIAAYRLDGLDIDVEQRMSQKGITRLVRRLRQDFGPDFIITQAPAASALLRSDGALSGFSYQQLENEVGADIAFYNTQFYNGLGSMVGADTFESIVDAGWPPTKIVAGQLTSPANGGGFVPHEQLNKTITELRDRYGEIGGIMGWEYFNSAPGGRARPWEWAQIMTAILRPNSVPVLTVSDATARSLLQAWKASTFSGAAENQPDRETNSGPSVDYMAMVVG